MRKKLLLNTGTSLLLQITTIVCGLILPRFILINFGSEVNGLVSSINQFLSLIMFLELGVGAVVQTSLYKPLAEKNNTKISEIIASGEKFFRRIAYVLVVYVVVLVFCYPSISNSDFDDVYTAMLIIAMSISSFAQYYFGIIDRLLLTADQKGYIQYTAQIITIIFNTIASIIAIEFGASIHVVKLITSIIFLVRPLVLRWYINRKYIIDRKICIVGEPIQQKWNGIAQHIAAIVLADTDTVVLTIFSTLTNVSIYSVYFMVINGIKSLLLALTNGAQSAIGEMWVKKEYKKMTDFFSNLELLVHMITTLVFSCTAVLIVPFVKVYTAGIADVNYTQPLFAFFLVLAYACYSLRTPYLMMVLAVGHYKQTQNSFIVAAALNVLTSIFFVKYAGLVGVAIGTLIAMCYQTLWLVIYDSKKLINRSIKCFIRLTIVDGIVWGLVYLFTNKIVLEELTYISWFWMAIKVFLVALIISITVNMFFNRKLVKNGVVYIVGKNKGRKG